MDGSTNYTYVIVYTIDLLHNGNTPEIESANQLLYNKKHKIKFRHYKKLQKYLTGIGKYVSKNSVLCFFAYDSRNILFASSIITLYLSLGGLSLGGKLNINIG